VIVPSVLEPLRLSAVLGALRLWRWLRSAAAIVVAALLGFFTEMIVFAMVLDVLAAELMCTAASPSLHAGVMYPPRSHVAPPHATMLLPRAASGPADRP
jgi:hypothetical protein